MERISANLSARTSSRVAFARYLSAKYPDRSVKGWEMAIWRYDNAHPETDTTTPHHTPTAQSEPYLLADTYLYDAESDTYTTHLKTANSFVSVPGETHRAMLADYSDMLGTPLTIKEISRLHNFPSRWLSEYSRIFKWTHGSDPFTDEEISVFTEAELATALIEKKRNAFLQRATTEETKQIHADAAAYRDLQLTLLNEFRTLLPAPLTKIKKLKMPASDRPYALIISPTDFHWGKHGWEDETGETYNFTEAKHRLMTKTGELISRLPGAPEKIILGAASDFFHIDNDAATTTKGTPQDTCGSPAQILMTGCKLAREHIELLRQVAPIQVVFMPGNHDRHSSYALMMYLSAAYENTPDVEIIVSPKSRQYLTYGDTLLGFTHGDSTKQKQLPSLMSTEAQGEWGSHTHHLWFHGHLHHQTLHETAGCTIIQLPSLAGHDRYHYRHGYTQSQAGLAAHLIDREQGLIGYLFTPVLHQDNS